MDPEQFALLVDESPRINLDNYVFENKKSPALAGLFYSARGRHEARLAPGFANSG